MISTTENIPTGKAPRKPITPAQASIVSDDDFENLVALLGVYSEAGNRLAQMEAAVNEQWLEIVDDELKDYTDLQKSFTEAGAALEIIARRHPEWFLDGKTIKTPFGTAALKNNPPKLEAENPEATILMIQHAIEKAEQLRDGGEQANALRKFLRVETTLNLEALSSLTDAELAKFRIVRTQADTFSVKAAKIDLGKAAVKATKNKEAKASK